MLDERTYQHKKAEETIWAIDFVKKIYEIDDPAVRYRNLTAITDLRDMMYKSAEKFADRVCFMDKKKRGGDYFEITYREMLEQVNGLGTKFIDLGLKDKRIVIIGENSHKWAETYLAAVCGTGVIVPIDKMLSKEEILPLVKASEASAVVFDEVFEEIFRNMRDSGETNLEVLISMQGKKHDDVLLFDEVRAEGIKLASEGDRRFLDAQVVNDVMSVLLFTSGTTGSPKGVMLSHKNLAADLMAAPAIIKVGPEDRFFSFLPMHHTYECTEGFLMPIYRGSSVAYCEGLRYIVKNLEEAQPTIFLCVPAVLESLSKKIWQTARKSGKEKLLRNALKINRVTKKVKLDIGSIAFKDIRKLFGGRMRLLITGGAAINPEILDTLNEFGVMAIQGYGMTECAPLGALNPDYKFKAASIGRHLPNFDAKIDNIGEDGLGEICVKGENVMMGYYNSPDLTAEVIDEEGWLHTGDLGYMDEEGYIFITGRAKNVIITKNGENVYPEELEYYLSLNPWIQESMVWEKPNQEGDDTLIFASVKLDDEEFANAFGEKTDAEKEAIIWKACEEANKILPYYKRIKGSMMRKEEFEKNSSKKIKRFAESNRQ